jgi:hypothetical protein
MLTKLCKKRRKTPRFTAPSRGTIGLAVPVLTRLSTPRPSPLQRLSSSLFREGMAFGLAVAALAVVII